MDRCEFPDRTERGASTCRAWSLHDASGSGEGEVIKRSAAGGAIGLTVLFRRIPASDAAHAERRVALAGGGVGYRVAIQVQGDVVGSHSEKHEFGEDTSLSRMYVAPASFSGPHEFRCRGFEEADARP
jgi:hypothetical protein